jgi:hypothetical protein
MIHHFSQLSPALAELAVEGKDSGFTLHAVHPRVHRLGFAGSPLFEIERDPSPDEPCNICCFALRATTGHPDELLLVIPRTGPLVFDNMEEYSAAKSAEDKRLWHEKHAEAFARKLAMPAPE